jgi:hypothetical protein
MLKIKLKIFLIFLFVIFIAVAIWQALRFFPLRGNILISTDKGEYKKGESIIVEIENKTNKQICFSSCYPYYLEKKDGNWKSYLYDNCPKLNLTNNCIKVGGKKFFQIEDLSYTQEGIHRLAIPLCVGCNLVENFKESKRVYSNEFLIK